MGRKFDIPQFYRSSIISTLKQARRLEDQRKKNLSPTVLDLGSIRFKIARHFGFCFGVENAIERAYRALAENPGKRVFLLSEMIHNPHVNQDLVRRGIRFIFEPDGTQLVPFDALTPEDIVIIPAFGTTVEMFETLKKRQVNIDSYNTTCPFVEKVWKRAEQLGERGYTIVIHGKHSHEETRATFSHATLAAPSLVIRDLDEAKLLGKYLTKEVSFESFEGDFKGRFSPGFDPERDLKKIGVVNQTTMLATETQSISDYLKQCMLRYYGATDLVAHFADTRDTLCYATSENQDATKGLIASGGDLALVVGGYNSSNTSHLVELLDEKVPTFYVQDADEILDVSLIRHLDLHTMKVVESKEWLPARRPLEVLITAGASCPDSLVDKVLQKVATLGNAERSLEAALESALQGLGSAADSQESAPH